MKKKLVKILGVGLTLTLLVSLLGVVTPVAANPADNVWEETHVPKAGSTYGYQLTAKASGFIDGPIAQAVDGTLFAYNNYSSSGVLYKSTTDGASWSRVGTQVTALVDIACSPSDKDMLYIATATEVRASIDGGATFITKVALTGGETITSIDVGELGGNHMVLIGTSNGTLGADGNWGKVYLFNEGAYPAALTDMAVGSIDVLEVAVSPNFGSDQGIFIAGLSDTTTLQVMNKIGAAAWGSNLANVTCVAATTTTASIAFPDDFSATTSGMANWYVGYNGAGTNEGVYLVQGFSGTSQKVRISAVMDVASLAVTGNTGSTTKILAGLTGGTIVFSDNGGDTWKSDSSTGIKKQPSGTSNAIVVMDNDFASNGMAWAATSGLSGAVSMTTNSCVSWNQVGLINTSIGNITDVSVVDGVVFMATDDGIGDQVLMTCTATGNVTVTLLTGALSFTAGTGSPTIATASGVTTITFGTVGDTALATATQDGTTATHANTTGASTNTVSRDVDSDAAAGTNWSLPDNDSYSSIWRKASDWQRVWSSTNDNGIVEMSSDYDSDSTVFTGNIAGTAIWRSTDGGEIWTAQHSAVPFAMSAWVVAGPSELIVGCSTNNKTYRTTNNGLTWIASTTTLYADPYSIFKSTRAAGYYLMGTTGGFPYVSTNSGETWTILGSGLGSNMVAHYGPKSGYMWVTSTTGVYRAGSDYVFSRIDNLAGTPAGGDVVTGTGLVFSADGALYATDSSAAGQGVSRCLQGETEGGNLGSLLSATTYPYFERVNGTATGTLAATISGLWIDDDVLWTVYDGNELWTYADTLNVPISDVATTFTQTSATIEWTAITGATNYEYEVNTREDFLGADMHPTANDTSLNVVSVPGLTAGTAYYVRVRGTAPVRTLYSDVMSFTTTLGQPTGSAAWVAPSPGAQDVSPNPVFTWGETPSATGYEFQLTEDPSFYETPSLLLENATVTINTYVGLPLAYSTTYYWRVRAIGTGTESAWTNGVFTTMDKPEDAAPIVITEPGQTTIEIVEVPVETIVQQPIPSYILWTVVAIGALLIIALIVLIVRTRRVA